MKQQRGIYILHKIHGRKYKKQSRLENYFFYYYFYFFSISVLKKRIYLINFVAVDRTFKNVL